MKKYWVLIVISVLMVASVGTFYIQSGLAANNMPEFMIEKISGDEKEIESLSFLGFYYDELSYIGDSFNIDQDGITYWQNKSFIERIDVSYSSPGINKMRKDHRNFIRGKYHDIYSFVENEEILAYTDVSYKNPYSISNEFQFTVDVLDKQTNKRISFDHLVPNGGDFWYLDVNKIQVIDGQLKVITINAMRESDRQVVHLYTFDLEKKTLVNDEVISSSDNSGDENEYIWSLPVDDPTEESDHVVFMKRTSRNNEVEVDGYSEWVQEVNKEELIVYDFPTDTTKTIDLAGVIDDEYPEHLSGSDIYFTDFSVEGLLTVSVYDLLSEQIVDSSEIELSDTPEGRTISFHDGKLYIVDAYADLDVSAPIQVIDLKTGETLYMGEIKHKSQDQKEGKNKTKLDIYDISFN